MGKSRKGWVSASASTRSMAIERRRVLQMLGGWALAGTALPWSAGASSSNASRLGTQREFDDYYLAARKRGEAYEAVVFDARGVEQQRVRLQDRGHSFALDPLTQRVVAFGRQPGFFAVMFDVRGRRQPQIVPAAPGRHFFGHGVFVDGGRRLLATENDYEAGRGVLGVYETSGDTCSRVDEFDCAGIGPHEVVALPGTNLVVVANGGILTHPDYGKMSLNLPTMRPSLVYLDATTGALVEQVWLRPEWHQLSIRHLAVDAGNRVWFGCQYLGLPADRPPLVGRHERGAKPELFEGDPHLLATLRNYVGSIAVNDSASVIATSSPVGGVVAYWRAEDGGLLGSTAIADGCGVAPGPGQGFLVSSGRGVLERAGPHQNAQALSHNRVVAWDNHMRRMRVAV